MLLDFVIVCCILKEMFVATNENPFAILTLIAAPAVFTNASSVLTLGTSNRLARVVDRTRTIAREMQNNPAGDDVNQLWVRHLGRLEKRGALLLRAMSFFYGAIGSFAAASLVSLLGASMAASQFSRIPFTPFAVVSFVAGSVGFFGLVIGCVFLVNETRLALASMFEEVHLAKSWSR